MKNNIQATHDLREKSKKIEDIYNKAIAKIKELEKKQKEIVRAYIKKLEFKKIEELRKSIQNIK